MKISLTNGWNIEGNDSFRVHKVEKFHIIKADQSLIIELNFLTILSEENYIIENCY